MNFPVFSSSLYSIIAKRPLSAFFSNPSPADQGINLSFLKSDRISYQTPVVPGVQHSFSRVIGHHGVDPELIGELNMGVPLSSSLCVVSKVDGRGL